HPRTYPGAGNILTARSTASLPPPPAHSMSSSCTWFAATSQICRLACITSPPTTLGYAGYVTEITVVSSLKRLRVSPPSLTHHLSLFAPAPIGGMLGNTRHAPTAILAGTPAPYSPTFWP